MILLLYLCLFFLGLDRIQANFQQIELSREDFDKISAIGAEHHTRYEFFNFFLVRCMDKLRWKSLCSGT